MAERSNAEPRRATGQPLPPPPIAKEMQGPENTIPLSPQWLLPKPGDTKQGLHSGESHSSLIHGSGSIATKTLGNGDDFPDFEKKKDVFRPSIREADLGRHDRWRDEERDANSSTRKDRWRDGEKELGDSRRMDLWADNSSKHSADGRKFPPERWNDASNRDKNVDQRRESKWNTRWGHDGKDSESWREKWTDIGRDNEVSRDKGLVQANNQARDSEKDGDNYSRPWRQNLSQPRGREPMQSQNAMTNKSGPLHGHGRGKGEIGSSILPPGHGKISSTIGSVNSYASHPSNLTSAMDKSDSDRGNSSALRYSRIKLLDIYRLTKVTNNMTFLDASLFSEVPFLIQAEVLEPLALSAPSTDEMAALKGIEKGDMVSSGAHQVKDASVGRNVGDAASSPRLRSGGREDFPPPFGTYKDGNVEGPDLIEQIGVSTSSGGKSEGTFSRKPDSIPVKEGGLHERPFAHPWRPQSTNEQLHGLSSDWKDVPSEMRSRPMDIGRSQFQKEREAELRSMPISPLYYASELHQPANFPHGTVTNISNKGQTSMLMDRDRVVSPEESLFLRDRTDARRSQICTNPEEMSFYYKDPQGQIQGPFTGADLVGWLEAGYFGIDLQVRLADAPRDSPFSQLGDVMPHLRMKARPPPGFNTPKPVDIDVPFRDKVLTSGKAHSGIGDFDVSNSGQRNITGPATETENRFVESLMPGPISPSTRHEPVHLSEGKQSYGSPVVGDAATNMNYLLAQRLSLENQRTTSSNLAYWGGRDGVPLPVASKSGIMPEPAASHQEILPPPDSRQFSHPPQQLDLLSLLQKGADNSARPAVTMEGHGWPAITDAQSLNSVMHGGTGILQSQMELQPNIAQQIISGAQKQLLQQQNQPSLSHVAMHPGERSSNHIPPEVLLNPGISQDPQVLALLQQQYLLSQLQLQTPVSIPSHPSVLDKILLIKQQQNQEQQLLLQQQQQLLSQVLSEKQSHQHFGEQSYGILPGTSNVGCVPTHHFEGKQTHGELPIGMQVPPHSQVDLQTTNIPNLAALFPKEAISSITPKPSIESEAQPGSSHAIPQEVGNLQEGDGKSAADIIDTKTSMFSETLDSPTETVGVKDSDVSNRSTAGKDVEVAHSDGNEGVLETTGSASALSEQMNDLKVSLGDSPKPCEVDPPVARTKLKKTSDKKSKKQKNLKSQSVTEPVKKESFSQQSKTNVDVGEIPVSSPIKPQIEAHESHFEKLVGAVDEKTSMSNANETGWDKETDVIKGGSADGNPSLAMNPQASSQQAWKPAPGFKPKSLVEIQQEEQRRAQMEEQPVLIGVAPHVSASSPWGGIGSLENKSRREVLLDGSNMFPNKEVAVNSKGGKSHLHDLLAEEVLAKSVEASASFPSIVDKNSSVTSQQSMAPIQADLSNNDDFVEAKDTKKNRRKASKSKGSKSPAPVASSDYPILPVPTEKSKILHEVQPEKELLPPPPSGPSLADFVPWREEQAPAVTAPAWSTSSSKVQRPVSLRDILKEQEKMTPAPVSPPSPAPIPTPTKAPLNRNTSGTGSSWQMPGSSPSKGSVPTKVSSVASASSKSKIEDDLFWGPLDNAKQDSKALGFPSLPTSNSRVTKGNPGKGARTSNQKSLGSKTSFPLSSSPSRAFHSSKGARSTTNRISEATGFREWCESELVRLTGTKDTGFLEFCVKQPTSEAEALLRENLGSLDPNHEFIDKFLNYKELLPSDVLDIAFQDDIGSKPIIISDHPEYGSKGAAAAEADADMGPPDGSKGAGKKKKKGKKVSPSTLGFSVVSSRIMKGEIQTPED